MQSQPLQISAKPGNLRFPFSEWSEFDLYGFEYREPLSISQWAERYRNLSRLSEEKGALRMRRTPYLPGILDTVQKPHVETVVLMKPAQIAGTEGAVCIVGYYEHYEPCPAMVVLADEDTAVHIARERIQPLFSESEELRALKGSVWTKEELELSNGGYIAIGWASSVARLASRPIRILILDEIDKPGYSVTSKEGSPIGLAIQRTETFYNRKILLLSTPTVAEGNITRALAGCDVVFDFHVPCPHCGLFQPLRWSRQYAFGFPDGVFRGADGEKYPLGQVIWNGGRKATEEQVAAAGYQCGVCEKLWPTTEKNLAVERGTWVAREPGPDNPAKVGFHVNRLYSLLGRSGDIPKLVRDYCDALKSYDPRDLQNFVNSALAEPWVQTVAKTTEGAILKARVDLAPHTVPADVVALTAGIDAQKHGFWYAVRGWLRNFTSYLIAYGWLGSWDELESFFFETRYPVAKPDGSPGSATLGIWRAGIDIGGTRVDDEISMTERAYLWLRRNGAGRGPLIYGTKGASHSQATMVRFGKPLDKTPSGKPLPGGLQIVTIDTERAKDMFFYRLTNAAAGDEIAPAYLHKKTGIDYAKQITAEEKRVDEKGHKSWVQVREDNHLLDAEVIAMVCAEPEFIGGGVNLLFPPKTKQKPPAEKSASDRSDQGRRGGFRRPKWLDR